MTSRTSTLIFAVRLLSAITLAAIMMLGAARAQVGLKTYTGTFHDGATYLLEVPRNWNKTLFLYSHGYTMPGTPNPPADNGDLLVRLYLLSHGYALAGSSYAMTGWAIADAFNDQIAVLDKFNELVGRLANPAAPSRGVTRWAGSSVPDWCKIILTVSPVLSLYAECWQEA